MPRPVTASRLIPRTRRAIVTSSIAVVAVLVGAGVAFGVIEPSSQASADQLDAGTPANLAAVATNGKDGSEVYSLRLKVVKINGPVVDPQNVAVAVASCNNCTTVAISIEGVLVTSDYVTDVTPVNVAVALNSNCFNCNTLAAAYQSVTQTGTAVRITPAGHKAIGALRKQLHELRKENLTIPEIQAQAAQIAQQFFQILKTDVVPIGDHKNDTPTPSASPVASSTPSPSSGATSGTPTPAPSTATSPSAIASPPAESPASSPQPS